MKHIFLGRSGSPYFLWLLMMLYVVFLLNRVNHSSIGWVVSTNKSFVITPDIVMLI